jgi:pyridinium-3,5-biscarboxylic acid mononucleotide synthase
MTFQETCSMSSSHNSLRQVLADVVPQHQLTPELLQQIQNVARQSGDADVDLQRKQRCGFPEVVYGEGKSPQLITSIVGEQQAAGQPSLVTRSDPDTATAVAGEFPRAIHNPVGRTIRVPVAGSPSADTVGLVVVITAGSCDRPVAEEACETLQWMRVGWQLVQDVGVAGPHRLLRHVELLQRADAIVCIAGMEAALPSVLGGHVSCPVIGVPTSVGYGASLGGITALLSMMTCCASNVTVVNIDAGFKGAFVAGIIATRIAAARVAAQDS